MFITSYLHPQLRLSLLRRRKNWLRKKYRLRKKPKTPTKEGVVLAVQKRITSSLLEPSSVEKIMEIDEHIGCATSGLIADACTLVEHARVETQNHRFSYGEPMTVESTTQALRFGEGDEESMGAFGVSLLIAGHDENGPSLTSTRSTPGKKEAAAAPKPTPKTATAKITAVKKTPAAPVKRAASSKKAYSPIIHKNPRAVIVCRPEPLSFNRRRN